VSFLQKDTFAYYGVSLLGPFGQLFFFSSPWVIMSEEVEKRAGALSHEIPPNNSLSSIFLCKDTTISLFVFHKIIVTTKKLHKNKYVLILNNKE